MGNNMKSLSHYYRVYGDFYDAILQLAKMENDFSKREPSDEEIREYSGLKRDVLSECPEGTDIEDLIGLVVVGEVRKCKDLNKLAGNLLEELLPLTMEPALEKMGDVVRSERDELVDNAFGFF